SQPEAFHDARAVRFDEGIGIVDESQRRLDSGWSLEVDGHRPTPAIHQVGTSVVGRQAAATFRTTDPDNFRAHVREEHRAERTWSRSDELDDPQASKWSHPEPFVLDESACDVCRTGINMPRPRTTRRSDAAMGSGRSQVDPSQVALDLATPRALRE